MSFNNNKKGSVVADRVCVKYEIGFKREDMDKKKLTQEFNDGTKRTREIAVFTGSEGIEGLMFVYREFEKACVHLEFDTGREKFDNFGMLLSGSAADNWSTLTDNIGVGQMTVALFNQMFREFVLKYCTSDARDLLFDYLRSSDCRKPHDTDVRIHSERIRTLCGLANRLPGMMPVLDEQMKKKILFDSFPEKWGLEFVKARRYETATEQDIIDFMCIQKTVADQGERKRTFGGRGGGPPAQRGRFGGRGPGRGFGMNGRGFGGRFGFNGGGRNNFFGNRGGFNNGGRFNNNGYSGNSYNQNNGNGGSYNNGNGGRFQGRFQNNFNRGRGPAGRAPMGRGPPAASQHQNYMIQGREPQDGSANGNNASGTQASSTHENYNYEGYNDGYYYDEQQNYDEQNYYYEDGNWQQDYGYDNFYTDYENDQAGW